jgi:hypothetical protein
MSAPRRAALPFLALPERRLPADSWFPGHMPAQLARWSAVGNRPMSTPISAMIAWAMTFPMPMMVQSRSTWRSMGGSSLPTGIEQLAQGIEEFK